MYLITFVFLTNRINNSFIGNVTSRNCQCFLLYKIRVKNLGSNNNEIRALIERFMFKICKSKATEAKMCVKKFLYRSYL